jgi:glycolate oxidase
MARSPQPTILRDAESLDRVATDRSGYRPSALPDGVVVATSVEDVIQTMRYAHEHRIPVVTRGAGSGLAGASSATTGEIVLDLGSMNSILHLDAIEALAVVEPGVLNSAVSEAAKPHGLFYAPDPASMTYCSIGGNIATNAGGMRCAKYGVTRESVLGLKVVLADGTVLNTGGQTIKRVSGYDLTALMIGSEGTLGVVVEATLRLRPLPELVTTLVAYFENVGAAASCASALVRSRIQPTILELMDGKTLGAVDEATGTNHATKGGALLLVQTDGMGASLEMEVLASIVEGFSTHQELTNDLDVAESLVQARREAIPSISKRGFAYVGDVGVPRKHLATMAEALVEIGEETGVDIYTIAHAGDGNLHPILVLGEGEGIDSGPAKKALDQMFWTAHRLGGTLTGEHGVGVLKRDWLVPELGEESLRLQREIKQVFDPQGILNPGKAIFPGTH